MGAKNPVIIRRMDGREGGVGLGKLERMPRLTRQALALLESQHREAERREKLRRMKRRREAKGQAKRGCTTESLHERSGDNV